MTTYLVTVQDRGYEVTLEILAYSVTTAIAKALALHPHGKITMIEGTR